MKVGDLVKLKGDDIRGSGRSGQWPMIPAGTVGIVVPSPDTTEHHRARPFVKLCGHRETRPFLAYDLEIINASR